MKIKLFILRRGNGLSARVWRRRVPVRVVGHGLQGRLGRSQLGHNKLRQLWPRHVDRVSVCYPRGMDRRSL